MTEKICEPLIIGIDLGTTACKTAIITKSGRILEIAYSEYPLINISPKQVEQDANEWWSLVLKLLKEILGKITPKDKSNIKAIGISSQGITFVPVDEKGDPLINAITWLDSRADREALELIDRIGEKEIFLKSGIQAIPVYMFPKIMWLKKNKPEIYKKVYRFCTSQDFLTYKLTGKFVTDYSIAGGSLMHDITKLEWSDDFLSIAKLPKSKLPELKWSGEIVGPLNSMLADELEIPADTLVVLGGHDQECAGVGAGLQNNNMTISLGTASILLASIDKPVFDKLMRIPCLPSVEKNKWVLEGVVSIGGAGLRWIRDMLNGFTGLLHETDMQEPDIDYDKLVSIAENVKPGESETMFFSHMTGATSPYWIPTATGVFYGVSLSTTMPHMIRAIIEGWIFQLKSNFNVIRELAYNPENIIIFGGAAKSRFIQHLIADILNKPVLVPQTTETALLGAGILAGVGSGVYRDVPSAQREVIRASGCVMPNPENVQKYIPIYERFLKIEQKIINI